MSNFDETVIRRLTALEREVERLRVKERPVGGGGGVTDHGALTGLSDNDHPQYLLTTGKAADSDKLDGNDSTGFATANHNHSGVYLPISGKAADSDKLDGNDSTAFATSTHSHDHGNLTGLTDDDHTQYVKDAGTVTDNAIVRFNGTDGRTIQNSGVTIDDSNNLITTGGIHVGGTSDPGTDNLVVDGTIKDGSGNLYGRPVFLTTPKTSTSWDGDAYSTTAKTKIDLSEVFGVPAGIKAVLVWVAVRDSASQTTDCYLRLSPVSTGDAGMGVNCDYVNDRYGRHLLIVPCDANGDIYYQIAASGTGTMDVFLQIWGYWL